MTFRILRVAEGDRKILAEYLDSEQREIIAFASKADADGWINGDRKIAWLHTQGYAKRLESKCPDRPNRSDSAGLHPAIREARARRERLARKVICSAKTSG